MTSVIEEAPAKVNLILHVGVRRPDGLHPVASLFASLALRDCVSVEVAKSGPDTVVCPGVDGPNLAGRAIAAFRAAASDVQLGPVRVAIDKQIPVAAGLGGGSADAAAVLRAVNTLADGPLDDLELMRIAASLGSDVPSQIVPAHALVQGVGELVEPVELAPLALVLLPRVEGLATSAVYAELDRLRADGVASERVRLDPDPLRAATARPPELLADVLENDLEPAALSLAPGLEGRLARLREAGAVAARVAGSGPTVFGLFAGHDAAEAVATTLPGAIVTRTA